MRLKIGPDPYCLLTVLGGDTVLIVALQMRERRKMLRWTTWSAWPLLGGEYKLLVYRFGERLRI